MSVAPLVFLPLGLALLPLIALAYIAVSGSDGVWSHLLRYVLPATAFQTTALLLLVAFGTAILGASTAWLTTLCQFPGHRIFTWALMLPLAIPTYIAAYSHVELFDFSGPFQGLVRALGGYQSGRDYWFPDIRSLGGAGFIFSMVLYPYVYLTARLTFSMQGASALDVSRSLGANPWRMFWRIGLPLARPAIAAGVALALMETLNDIGAVEYLGVKTITFAIFDTWLNRDSLSGAVQLALLALVIVAGLVWVERRAQGKRSYATGNRERPPARLELTRPNQVLAFVACLLPILLGFGVPLYILGRYALRRLEQIGDPQLLSATGNSLLISFITATLAVGIAFCILLVARLSENKKLATFGRLTTLGYAIPGTVLAIGLLMPLAGFDNFLDSKMRDWFGISTGLFLSGSLAIVVYACTLRFIAIGWGALETGLGRISPQIDMAARGLGRTSLRLAREIHTPILRHAIGAAFLLVFVDTMKELSATLLVRPFGFETLATYIYDRASQAEVEEAALAALIIVVIGLLPVTLLTRVGTKKKRGNRSRV